MLDIDVFVEYHLISGRLQIPKWIHGDQTIYIEAINETIQTYQVNPVWILIMKDFI